MNGQIVRYKPGFKRSIHDADKLWSFVQSLPQSAITELFNPNDIKIGALKRYAESEGMDAEAIEDTFYMKEFTPPKVEGVDQEFAPKWTHDIEPGERKVSPYVRDE